MINVLSKINLTCRSYNKCFYKISCNFSCLLYAKMIEDKCKSVENICYQPVRFFSIPNPFAKKQNFRKIDRIPSNAKCVYASPIGLYMAYFYPLTVIFGSLTSAAAAYAIYLDLQTVFELPLKSEDYFPNIHAMELSKIQFAAVGGISFFMTSLIWTMAKRTPLRMYYDEEEELFIATFATLRPWKTYNVVFEPGDVVDKYPLREDIPNWSPKIFLGQYLLHEKKRIIIFPDNFVIPHYYNLMLGIYNEDLKDEED